jgi:hypothetical protein
VVGINACALVAGGTPWGPNGSMVLAWSVLTASEVGFVDCLGRLRPAL